MSFGGSINIALLQTRIVQELHNRDIQCIPFGTTELYLSKSGRDIYISLDNLWRSISVEGVAVDVVIKEFADNVVRWVHKESAAASIYPRFLVTPETKPLSHPWTQPFLGTQLEIGLVEHSQGRMRFLSPLQIVQHNGGVKEAKSRAVENLQPLLTQIEVQDVGNSVYVVYHPEVLTSSLVLFLDQFPNFHKLNTVQFAIPSRGTLFFSPTTLTTAEQHIMARYASEPYPISPQIFQASIHHIIDYRQSWMA